ncbi:MAG: hypothetical protein CMJ78_13020, partial [Planctomycetaceae bacterium]|nr:hypothetical protein [Planctomycetaceae bacterium]
MATENGFIGRVWREFRAGLPLLILPIVAFGIFFVFLQFAEEERQQYVAQNNANTMMAPGVPAVYAPVPLPKPVAKVDLVDGTELCIQAVTFGRQHRYDLKYRDFNRRVQNRRCSFNSSDENVAIWMVRRDPLTGVLLDFEWWSHSEIIDANGVGMRDSGARRYARGPSSSTSHGLQRPAQPVGPQYSQIIVCSTLPRIRLKDKTFKLRVFDRDDSQVGEFTIPLPTQLQKPQKTWTPDGLPISQRIGKVDVKLTQVRGYHTTASSGNRKIDATRLSATTLLTIDDKPTRDWQLTWNQVSDALGNKSYMYRCTLNPTEV